MPSLFAGERPEPTGAGPGGGPREERGEAPYRQPEARQGKKPAKPAAMIFEKSAGKSAKRRHFYIWPFCPGCHRCRRL
jgi:hypothetical protein